jgi:hypothetical protein
MLLALLGRNSTLVGLQVEFWWELWVIYKVDSCELWFISQYHGSVEFGTVVLLRLLSIHPFVCWRSIPAVSCAWSISICSISTDRFYGWRICELYIRTFGVSVTLMYGQRQAVMSFQMHMFMQVRFACLALPTCVKRCKHSWNCSFCTKWHLIIWYNTYIFNKENFTFEHSYNLDAHYCFVTNTVHTLVYNTLNEATLHIKKNICIGSLTTAYFFRNDWMLDWFI